jgi:hypothetical protein
MLCNQQRATELKGRRRELCSCAASMRVMLRAVKGQRARREKEPEVRLRATKTSILKAKILRKFNLNPNTLLSDYHSTERGWRRHDNERKREGGVVEDGERDVMVV